MKEKLNLTLEEKSIIGFLNSLIQMTSQVNNNSSSMFLKDSNNSLLKTIKFMIKNLENKHQKMIKRLNPIFDL